MSLAIVQHEGQLVVDSRLVAVELGIDHNSLYANLERYRSEFEQLGVFRFEIEKGTGGRPQRFIYLNESQATFAMTLSRNTPQVVAAKLKLVEAFDTAKKQLKGEANLDSTFAEALLHRLNKLDSVVKVSEEYLKIRKYADSVLPGLNELADAMLSPQFALPPIRIEFTAPEWVERYAPHLSQRQRICFYKEIASAHRFLVGQVQKERGMYLYSNKHEILFNRAKWVAETMIPKKTVKSLKPTLVALPNLIKLTQLETGLLGLELKLTDLARRLDYLPTYNDCSRLAMHVRYFVKAQVVARPLNYSNHKRYVVTPTLIHIVNSFFKESHGQKQTSENHISSSDSTPKSC